MANIVKSFSYDLKDVSSVTDAEDKAKEAGKSFSQYIIDLIKADLKKKRSPEH